MIEEEGALEVLGSFVIPIIGLMRKTGYFDLQRAAEAEAKRLGPQYYVTLAPFQKGARRLFARKNARFYPFIVEAMPSERARKYFQAHGVNRLVGQMTDSDMRFIKKFMLKNWPIHEREAARLMKKSYICSPARIKTIVRTEGKRARHGSRLEKEIEKGLFKYKIWDCIGDPSSRKSHVKRDGEKRLLNEPFSGGVMFPGDGPAHEAINCRCSMGYSIK